MGAMVLWAVVRAIVVLGWMSGEAPSLLAVSNGPVPAAGAPLSIKIPPLTVVSVPKGEWAVARGGTLVQTDLGDGIEAFHRRPPRIWSMFVRTGRLPTVMADLDWRRKSHLEMNSRVSGQGLAVVGWGSTGRVNVAAPPRWNHAAGVTAGGGYGVFPVLSALLSPFLIPANPIIIKEVAVSVALFVGGWKLIVGGLTLETPWVRAAASPGVQLVCSAVFGVTTEKLGASLQFHVISAVLWWVGSLRWAATSLYAEDFGTSLWLRASGGSPGASQDHAGFWLRPPLSETGTVAGFGCGGAENYGLSLSITPATTAGLQQGMVVSHVLALGGGRVVATRLGQGEYVVAGYRPRDREVRWARLLEHNSD
eukprot:g7624.t1